MLPEGAKRSHEDAVRPNAGLVGDEQHLLERVGKALGSQGRLAAARTRPEVAREFGLAIVKHLVIAHGGDLRIESEPGRGTTVRFTLPASAPGPA